MFLDFLKLEFEKPDSSIVFNNGPKVNIEELKRINFVLGDSIGFSYKGIYHEFVVEHKYGNRAYFVSKLPLEESRRSDLYDTLSQIREHFPTGLIGIMARTANEMSGRIYKHDNIFIPSIKNVGISIWGRKFYKGDDTKYKRFANYNNRLKGFSWWVDDYLVSSYGIKVNTYGMATYADKDETCGVIVAFAVNTTPYSGDIHHRLKY